ncbi:MAG: leucine-rich repeat domain-containing protein, partial [Spirochaetaceae bacterium]|nr:leucine-rich repeat domain-containing protein [Spirochaetaceae bacterium]
MDFCKTKKSPARLWTLVVGALLLGGGGAALLSSCDEMRALMGESDEKPSTDSNSQQSKPTTITQVNDALKAGGEPVKLVIGAGPTFTWEELLDAIKAKAKTVALDISATTLAVDDGVFDPRYSGGTTPLGESFITKLTLPNEATEIAGGTSDNRTFAGFTGLVEVSADKVATINSSAFRGTGKLEKAYFRAVESIGMQAFQDCPALAHLYLPEESPELIGV